MKDPRIDKLIEIISGLIVLLHSTIKCDCVYKRDVGVPANKHLSWCDLSSLDKIETNLNEIK